MSTVSFPQIFSLIKGANYSNHLYFTPLKYSTIRTGIQIQHIPYVSNFVPDSFNSTSIAYSLANSTSIYDSKLIFKYGGRLIDKEVGTFQVHKARIKTEIALRYEYGDVFALASSAGISNSSDFYTIENKYFVHSTRPGINESRCALVYAHPTIGLTFGTYSSSAVGYYTTVESNIALPAHFYWKGYLKPLETKAANGIDPNNNLLDDFRLWVGFGRDHTNWNNLYHPQVGGTPVSINFDRTSSLFVMFLDVNDSNKPKWWALLRYETSGGSIQIISAPTNLSVYSPQELEVIVTSTEIIWKANGNTVLTHTFDFVNNNYEQNPVFAGSSIRNLKFQRNGNIPNAKQEFITQYLSVRFDTTLSTSLVDVELAFQNTGLQLLKKLK